ASALDRVGNGAFIAVPWRPVPLGEPESLLERELAASLARAHRRIVAGDLAESEGGARPANGGVTALESGWDQLATIDQEDRHQRMRMVAEALPDRVGLDLWKAPVDRLPTANDTPSRKEDPALIRLVKDFFGSVTSGRFFTRDKIAIGLAILL